jgi:phage repressor protein C with HTH and peptisase S24 domain
MLPKIKDVISEDLGDARVFDKDVADALGINQLTFATMKNRGKIPYEEVLNFCAQKKISINWLFYDQATRSLEAQTEKYANVRYFTDVYASAGGGAFNYDAKHDNIMIDEHMILKLGGGREMKNIHSINVMGDSMEPTFKDGDIIFINRTQDDIRKGGVFVVTTPTGLFVKRLLLKSDGQIDMISDNLQYSVESVDPYSIEIVGKVVGSMSGV